MKYIDMHCDTLGYSYTHPDYDLLHTNTMVDLTRMKKGSAMAQFFAIYLFPEVGGEKFFGLDHPIDDDEFINWLHDALIRNINANSDIIALAKNAKDLEENDKAGKMSAFFTIEDGRSIRNSMEKLEKYYDMGIRLISLTHNFKNCLGSPNSKDPVIMAEGLTDFGKDAVRRMNELGIIVDVSHLSDGGFYDVAKISSKPFVASHSNCRALSPHQRNLTDDMIRVLAEKGGVAGINFGPEFLNSDITCKDSTVELFIKHIEHFIKLGGIECVGMGSDLDGVEGNMEVDSSDKFDLIWDGLAKAGYSEDKIEKIAWKNVFRVIKDVM